VDTAEKNQTTRRVAVIAGLCVLAVVCNLVGPGIFGDVVDTGRFTEHVAFVPVGALVAEVCLLGIWCGLSQQLIFVYTGLSSLLSIPSVWIAPTEWPHLSASLLLAGALIAGPFLVLVGTNIIFGEQGTGEMLSGVTCYEVGLTGTTLTVLLILRSLGYRMLVARDERTQLDEAVGMQNLAGSAGRPREDRLELKRS